MIMTVGPHASRVAQLVERAGELDTISVQRLFHAWGGLTASTTDPYMEPRCLRRARNEARRADRTKAFDEARTQAAERFRRAHRGDIGPTIGLSMAIANAAGALVVADLLDPETFDWLYGPWRIAIDDAPDLTPVGPGRLPFGAITERRRMNVPR